MAWQVTPASDSLLAEFNAAFPNRDKGTDGTKGDDAHAQRSSDHNPDETGKTPFEDADSINEVHARDIGDRLNRPGWTMARCIDIIVARHRAGLDRRLQNIIHHGKVISRSWSWDGWRDSSGHETWAHFGFRYGSGAGTSNPENITAPWGILAAIEEEDDMNAAEMTAWANSTAGQAALKKAAESASQEALENRRPMVIGRLADRGWGGDVGMSLRQLAEYNAEALVAGANVDLDNDGVPAESGSLQAALADIRAELENIKARLPEE